jgi:hypothetical protein
LNPFGESKEREAFGVLVAVALAGKVLERDPIGFGTSVEQWLVVIASLPLFALKDGT